MTDFAIQHGEFVAMLPFAAIYMLGLAVCIRAHVIDIHQRAGR